MALRCAGDTQRNNMEQSTFTTMISSTLIGKLILALPFPMSYRLAFTQQKLNAMVSPMRCHSSSALHWVSALQTSPYSYPPSHTACMATTHAPTSNRNGKSALTNGMPIPGTRPNIRSTVCLPITFIMTARAFVTPRIDVRCLT